jgi:DNA-binding response OmpR family regulator
MSQGRPDSDTLPAPQYSAVPLHSETKRILIADDNHDWADSLAMLLAHEGYSVRTSYDGREAIEAAREFRPHIVVLDIRMPKMTGFEAARVFNREDSEDRPLLIAITGSPGESDKLRATMCGFDHYFGKPLRPADILELVKNANPRKDPTDI